MQNLTNFEGCANICEEEFHSCENGWTFDMGQSKVTIILSIKFKDFLQFLSNFQCFYNVGKNRTMKYAKNWISGQSACGVFEEEYEKHCFDISET